MILNIHLVGRRAAGIAFICVLAIVAKAQSTADSLNQALRQNNLTVRERITTTIALIDTKLEKDPYGALTLANQALQLAHTLKDAQYKALVHATLAQLYYFTGKNMAGCRTAADSALAYASQTPDRRTKGIAWYRKAWLDNIEGNDEQSVQNYLKALPYFLKQNSADYESLTYYHLVASYAEKGDIQLQKKYTWLNLKAARESRNYDLLAFAFQNAANYYQAAYTRDTQKQALLDSALYFNRQAISIMQHHRDKIIFYGNMAVVMQNTANLFASYFPASYKDSVMHYLNIALKTALETGHVSAAANSYGMMSDYAIADGDFKRADHLLLTGLAKLRADSVERNELQTQFLVALSSLNEKKGDLSTALKYYKEYNKLYTKVYDADKLSIIEKMEAQYQAEKHEAEIKALQKQAAQDKKLNYLSGSLAIVLLVALIYIFRSYRFRLKASLHKQQLLKQEKEDADLKAQIKEQESKQMALEKQEALLQAELKEEEAMRLIAEQELLYERQARLQKELLAGTLEVEQKNELLQTLQKKIEENRKDHAVLNQINQIIDKNMKIDGALAASKADLEAVHPRFFEKLKEKSANTLSRLDLKHCSYILMGFTNKEVAQRLGIAPKSILMARYRIKLKLGLGKEDDLDAFILKLR